MAGQDRDHVQMNPSDQMASHVQQGSKKNPVLIKVAQNSFHHSKMYMMGHNNQSISVDATKVVSKSCPVIEEHVDVNFATQ